MGETLNEDAFIKNKQRIKCLETAFARKRAIVLKLNKSNIQEY